MKQALLKQTADEVRQYRPVRIVSTKAAAKPKQKPQRQEVTRKDVWIGMSQRAWFSVTGLSMPMAVSVIAFVTYTWEVPLLANLGVLQVTDGLWPSVVCNSMKTSSRADILISILG